MVCIYYVCECSGFVWYVGVGGWGVRVNLEATARNITFVSSMTRFCSSSKTNLNRTYIYLVEYCIRDQLHPTLTSLLRHEISTEVDVPRKTSTAGQKCIDF